jgi:cell division protease FtsH
VEINFQRPGMGEVWVNLAATFLIPLVIVVFLYLFIVRQANMGNNQALSFGRSRAKRLTDGMPTKTFADVAGVDEAKQELEEVVDFLKSAEKYKALGAEIPRGVLLMGPPGCGKTLLARAVAGEAHVPFFHISGSDFVEMFVGVGASRVRDLFEQAKSSKPCIVFIDELDAVGRHRGAGLGGGHDEREQTLNQLLVEMDGFEVNAGVIIMAATNRPDVLDPALLRPGRFDRRVVVDNPDYNGRREILELYIKSKPLEDNVSADVLARQTAGFSGADLSNLVNEAALLAARKGATKIAMEHMDESIERVIAGPERKSRIIRDAEKKILAYHEAGHAVVSRALPEADPVRKVTILPRGFALGYTLHLPAEDRFIHTSAQLMAEVTALLGGRVAEELVFSEITTGAQNDLERATEIARSMVCEFGMTEELGPRTLGRKQGPVFLGRDLVEDRNYSEEAAQRIDQEIRRLIDECYDRAREILEAQRPALDHVVQALLQRETIDGAELDRLIEEAMGTPPTLAVAA